MTHIDPHWNELYPGFELTIVKTHYTAHRPDYSYPARMIESDRPGWFAFDAEWALPDMDVDGILYETGGRIIEYFAPDKRFNIFHVFQRNGKSSGFYANVSELPTVTRVAPDTYTLTWIDCWLDVVKLPSGEILLLDEDELEASGLERRDPSHAKRIREAAQDAMNVLRSDEWVP